MKDLKNYLENQSVVYVLTFIGVALSVLLILAPFPKGMMYVTILVLAAAGSAALVMTKVNKEFLALVKEHLWLISGAVAIAGALFIFWSIILLFKFVLNLPSVLLFLIIFGGIIFFLARKYKKDNA